MKELVSRLLAQEETVCAIQSELTSVPALGPENGGQGEWDKAAMVEGLLRGCGVSNVRRLDSPDARVKSGSRPNIIARLEGRTRRRLWLFGHLDVVPPGDGWVGDPWRLRRDGDLVYGRGVEDNQQAVASMLILAKVLCSLGITPDLGLGLVFMADEECGSRHGLGHILAEAPEMFSPEDMYIVPDGGFPDASAIEIAEKAQLWLKFVVDGRQCHASTPDEGVNALVLASRLLCRLDGLRFSQSNGLFRPSVSTFVPTRHDANGEAINILPGRDVFYMDCRLLPGLEASVVLERVSGIIDGVCADYGGHVKVEVVHRQAASATDIGSPVVGALQAAIASVYNVAARPCGIGGATVAALLRHAGLPAAVWSCIRNTCHQPNECSSLSATCRDAAVFAHILMNGASHG